MLGKRSDQRGLFEADQLFLELVGPVSFHGQLAGLQGRLFRDEDFADLYCPDNGRASRPPSLLLQAHDQVSDAEAQRRATVDMSWKVTLGVDAYSRPFALSTQPCFRARPSSTGKTSARGGRSCKGWWLDCDSPSLGRAAAGVVCLPAL